MHNLSKYLKISRLLGYFSLVLLYAFAPHPGYAQYSFGFNLKGKKPHTLPFTLVSNLIVIKGDLNHHKNLNFILDTGIKHTIITDASLFPDQDFGQLKQLRIAGIGGHQDANAYVSSNNHFKFKRFEAKSLSVILLEEDMLRLSEFLGIKIHGIIGLDFFEKNPIAINFSNQIVKIFSCEKFKVSKRCGIEIPLQNINGRWFLDHISINDQLVKAPILIDTGSAHAFLFGNTDSTLFSSQAKKVEVNLGRGLTGDLLGYISRINKIKIFEQKLEKVLVSFPRDQFYAARFSFNEANRLGSVGVEAIKRFDLLFNLHEKKMYVRKNRHFNLPFEHDMSGLEIRTLGEENNKYYVHEVLSQSPAEKAGVEKGDQIWFINDKPTRELSISIINQILSGKDGDLIEMLLSRNNTFLEVKFYLKKKI